MLFSPSPQTPEKSLSSIATARAEIGAQFDVAVGEVEHGLGQAGGLHDTADLDRAFGLDQFANDAQECGRELYVPNYYSSPLKKKRAKGILKRNLFRTKDLGRQYLGIPPILPSNQANQRL